MKNRTNVLVIIACGLALAAGVSAVRAQSLPDPTRPPASFGNSATADDKPETSSLQSIIRSNRGKPAAIINGEYVVLGGRVGDARLVKIGEDSVTLKTATGLETLTLTTGVEKTPVVKGGMRAAKKRKNPGEEVKK